MSQNRVVALPLLILSIVYLYYGEQITLDFWSSDEVFNARSMPHLFGGFTLICSLLLLIIPSSESKVDIAALRNLRWRRFTLLLSAGFAYSFMIDPLGFIVTNSAFLCFGFFTLGARRPVVMIISALMISLTFYGIMTLLDIYLAPLPQFVSDWIDNA